MATRTTLQNGVLVGDPDNWVGGLEPTAGDDVVILHQMQISDEAEIHFKTILFGGNGKLFGVDIDAEITVDDGITWGVVDTASLSFEGDCGIIINADIDLAGCDFDGEWITMDGGAVTINGDWSALMTEGNNLQSSFSGGVFTLNGDFVMSGGNGEGNPFSANTSASLVMNGNGRILGGTYGAVMNDFRALLYAFNNARITMNGNLEGVGALILENNSAFNWSGSRTNAIPTFFYSDETGGYRPTFNFHGLSLTNSSTFVAVKFTDGVFEIDETAATTDQIVSVDGNTIEVTDITKFMIGETLTIDGETEQLRVRLINVGESVIDVEREVDGSAPTTLEADLFLEIPAREPAVFVHTNAASATIIPGLEFTINNNWVIPGAEEIIMASALRVSPDGSFKSDPLLIDDASDWVEVAKIPNAGKKQNLLLNLKISGAGAIGDLLIKDSPLPGGPYSNCIDDFSEPYNQAPEMSHIGDPLVIPAGETFRLVAKVSGSELLVLAKKSAGDTTMVISGNFF